IRSLQPGLHPEAEMVGTLTGRGFANIASLLGEVVREAPDGTPWELMLVQEFLHNQGDAWSWTQNMLERAVRDAVTPLQAEPPQQRADALKEFAVFAGVLGRRVGGMHTVMAQRSDDPAFTPEQADASDCQRWATAVSTRIDEALGLLAQPREWAPPQE